MKYVFIPVLVCTILFAGCKEENIKKDFYQKENLESRFSFNGNVADEINDGSVTNLGATFTHDRNGNGNGSVTFDGTDNDQTITIEKPVLDLTKDFTISLWFKPDLEQLKDDQGYLITSRLNLEGFEQGGLDISVRDDGSLHSVGYQLIPFKGVYHTIIENKVTDKAWQHVALVKQDSIIRFYFQGNLSDEDTIHNPEKLWNAKSWNIGSCYSINATSPTKLLREFSGSIDDLAFYNIGFNSKQIHDLYAYEKVFQ